MHLSPGVKLDGYEIVGLLGAGGMGEVYRARDPVLKREVAIKVLPAFVSQDAERLRRFEQEAQAAAALNHPNILGIYRFGVFEGAPYLVSELLEGDTLRQVLLRGPLPVRKAIEYGVQIAHGMAAAHEKGIVHRDLKPENLFVIRDGRVKILDFGLAKLTQPQTGAQQTMAESGSDAPTATHHATEPGLVMGTVGYMAPEQVRGKAVDSRADIFAFGAVLYEMLAGKRAFQRSTSADTMSAILNEDPPGISQIVQSTPLGLQRVVQRCLEKNAEQRFQSASDLAFALEALSESGISSGGAVVAASPRRWSQLLAWLGGLAAVLVVGAVGYYFATRHQSVPFEHYSIQKLMDGKHVAITAISPDGSYLAAVVRDVNGKQSLVLHHIPTNSERTVVENGSFSYNDVTFSPDGNYIYLMVDSIRASASDQADEYRIPVLGGQTTRVLEHVSAPPSFITASGRLCFYRQDSADTYKFLSASPDGGDEQVLAIGRKPFPGLPACDPDGRSAVFSSGYEIKTLHFTSGTTQVLAPSEALGAELIGLHWARDRKNLFAISWKTGRRNGQVSSLSYPSAKLHQITNDLGNYSGISLTADSKTIATTQYNGNAKFAEFALAQPANVEEHQSARITWFSWVDNDRIVVSDIESGLTVTDPRTDQSTAVSIADGRSYFHPTLCGPDVLVVSGTIANEDKPKIYKMHLDGSGATQLTEGPDDVFPECTADGKWLFYSDNRDMRDPRVWRKSLKGAGSPTSISASVWYNLSPDGKLLAIVNVSKEQAQIQVLATESLEVTWSFTPPLGLQNYIAFSADGKSLFYLTKAGSDTTIWQQQLRANHAAKVATLAGENVTWIRPSPDGKKLGLIISRPTSEAVLLRDVP